MKKKLLIILCLLIISNKAIAQTKGDIQLEGQLTLLMQTISSISYVSPVTVEPEVLSIKDKVSLAFKDVPRMVDIVKCESGFNQFDSKGNTLRSGTSDIGVMQINQIHWKEAKRLGLDIFNSDDDNIKMGRVIYEQQGLGGWSCNKKV